MGIVKIVIFIAAILNGSQAMAKIPVVTNGDLESMANQEWEAIKSRHAFDPSDPESINWAYRISPPLPTEWPPAQNYGVVYYGYPYGLAATGLADGEHIGEPWVQWEVASGELKNATVLSGELRPLAIQGVRPLDENGILLAHSRGYEHLIDLTRLPSKADPKTTQIRNYYCFWILHNGVIASHLAKFHKAFFAWLACG